MASLSKDESFEIRPILRQPAAELGTRARRTIDLILQATGELIMARGYGGARIDDIVQAAGVSRASFYTYFPSKAMPSSCWAPMPAPPSIGSSTPSRVGVWARPSGQTRWRHGCTSTSPSWTSTGHSSSPGRRRPTRTRGRLRPAWKRHLASLPPCQSSARGPARTPVRRSRAQIGLLFTSMLERTWSYRHLYGDALNDTELERNAALVLVALLDAPEEGA